MKFNRPLSASIFRGRSGEMKISPRRVYSIWRRCRSAFGPIDPSALTRQSSGMSNSDVFPSRNHPVDEIGSVLRLARPDREELEHVRPGRGERAPAFGEAILCDARRRRGTRNSCTSITRHEPDGVDGQRCIETRLVAAPRRPRHRCAASPPRPRRRPR